ncbi:MAG: transglutaminase-like cysteine peptidase [Dongiaceae bacterium]
MPLFVLVLPLVAPEARAGDIEDCRVLQIAACRRAAEAGDAEGQLLLGAMLETGTGVRQDPLEAAAWYRLAADRGSSLAASRLGALVAAHRLDPPDQLTVRSLPPFLPPFLPAITTRPARPDPSGATIISTDLGRLPKWQRVRDWIVEDSGRERDAALDGWARWAEGLRSRPVGERLVAINDRVNGSFRYAGDTEVWGERNHWPTPPEVIAKGVTDCKGYAIMKLWLARLAGVGDDNLKLVVGTLPVTHQMHAVLRVDAGGMPVVLDSLRSAVMADDATDLSPVLMADLQELQLFVDRLATIGN